MPTSAPTRRAASAVYRHNSGFTDWFEIALLTFALGAVMVLPSLFNFVLHTSSHAAGTAVASAILLALFGFRRQRRLSGGAGLALILLTVVLVHLSGAAVIHTVDLIKPLLSLALLTLLVLSAPPFALFIIQRSDATIDTAAKILLGLFSLVTLASWLHIQPMGADDFAKPAFPFTEPSHLALAYGTVAIFGAVRWNGWLRYLPLIVGIVGAYFLQNLTLVIVTALAVACALSSTRLILGGLLFFGILGSLDLSYFSDRIHISSNSGNLSVLIYLQGWDFVRSAFSQTLGWGYGFQQLGVVKIDSSASDHIFMLYRGSLNIEDGGFIFAKLVSEFGAIGLISIMIYTKFAVRQILSLRRAALKREQVGARQILFMAMVASYLVDIYVRGVGYFTGTSILMITGTVGLRYLQHTQRRVRGGRAEDRKGLNMQSNRLRRAG